MVAKTVFEPLEPVYEEVTSLYEGLALPRKDLNYIRLFMPFPEDDFERSSLGRHLACSMRSKLRGSRPRRARSGLLESLRRVVVLKSTRIQLCLEPVYSLFGCHMVHVRRDPRAILASVRRNNWGKWMKDIDLSDLLLAPRDGRAIYFLEWEELIGRLDRDRGDLRIIGYWALTEMFLEKCIYEQSVPVNQLRYEDAVRDPNEVFARIARSMELSVSPEGWSSLDALASPTTAPGRQNATSEERIWSWKSELDFESIRRIESLTAELGLEDWLV